MAPNFLLLSRAKAAGIAEVQSFSPECGDPSPLALLILRHLYARFRADWFGREPKDGERNIILVAKPGGVPCCDGSTVAGHYIIQTSQLETYPTPLANEIGHELTHLFVSPRRTNWLVETFCDGFSTRAAACIADGGVPGCDRDLWLADKSKGFSSTIPALERVKALQTWDHQYRFAWGNELLELLRREAIPYSVAANLAEFTEKPLSDFNTDPTDRQGTNSAPRVDDWLRSLNLEEPKRAALSAFLQGPPTTATASAA